MIYITGANGWIGLNLIKNIVQKKYHNWDVGHSNIHAFILKGSSKKNLRAISKDINIVEGDLLDKFSLEKFLEKSENGILFHTAGIIHPKKVNDFYKVNLKGTENILLESFKRKIKKMVFVSSNSPFGFNKLRNNHFDENSTYNPYMNYGNSKMQMEKMILKYSNELQFDFTIIRPPWFYGPFQPARQKRFYEMIKQGKFPIIGDGNNLRSMVHTDNLSQGLILAANNKVSSGKTYWIADERPYSMNEIVNTIRELFLNTYETSCNLRTIRLPNIISSIAEYTDLFIQKIGIYNQEIHVLSEMNKDITCDISLAKKELNYKPLIDLKQGMKIAMNEIY